MDYQGKVVIITGGASGLGGATAKMIAAGGGKVLIADVNTDLGTRFADEIGSGAQFIRCDVTSDADGKAAVAAACAMGTVVGLVNCAGVGSPGKTVGKEGPLPLEAFARVININLIGTFNMIRLAGAAMMGNTPNAEGERGVIVNTASVAAFDGQIGQSAYAASKGGIVGMTLPIAREFARDGIRVVTIAPGLFLTPLLQSLPPAAQESLGKQVPFPPRLGRPEEYAQMVGHVFSNLMLNGETIRLDGAIRMAPR
jgi:NAD(P)-dependent dehydrogenase (short-subunit alcohol dehydrogenase family)